MAQLKQSRWVKVHNAGEPHAEDENVMGISLDVDGCQAEVVYTVRSYKKVAHWLEEYLKAAQALQLMSDEVVPQIKIATEQAHREDEKVNVTGENWICDITRTEDGHFKVLMSWNTAEPVTKKAVVEKGEPKKRGRKKKEETENAPDTDS
ncbi:MAG: hypothetical protein R3Y55_03750 [Rikenellaceae bacterium]